MSKKKSIKEIKELHRFELRNNIGGVYFLFDEDDVVYVGQSKNVHGRVRNHHDKHFDSYSFIQEERITKRLELEAYYIDKFDPEYNFDKPDYYDLKRKADNVAGKEMKGDNNIRLIKSLYNTHKKRGFKKGWVYINYLKKADFYCKDDLSFMQSLLKYHKNWIDYKVEELRDEDKWKE